FRRFLSRTIRPSTAWTWSAPCPSPGASACWVGSAGSTGPLMRTPIFLFPCPAWSPFKKRRMATRSPWASARSGTSPSTLAHASNISASRKSGTTTSASRTWTCSRRACCTASSGATQLFLRVQHQLLHAPVEQLRDIEQILRRAGDFVNPSELLKLFARFAEHAEHLAVERQLVDPAREGVGGVQHLVRPGGDAHRPGRPRHHDLVGQRVDLRDVGVVADRGLRLRIVGHVDSDLAQEGSLAVEHLDAAVAAVGDVEVALRVRGDRMRRVELAGLGTAVAPGLHPVAVLVDLGDARVDVAVAD